MLRGLGDFTSVFSSILFTVACGQTAAPVQSAPRALVVAEVVEEDEDCVPLQDVQRALAARNIAFQDCYADGLAVDPTLNGTVTLAVVIPPSGEVDDVSISSTDLASEGVTACIVEVARGLSFAQESCPMAQKIEYPVRLRRGSSEFATR